jgi:hypothetical protein
VDEGVARKQGNQVLTIFKREVALIFVIFYFKKRFGRAVRYSAGLNAIPAQI